MISWDTCRDHFEPDGGLRDIFVRSTTIEDWRLHYQSLRATYPLEYLVDGQPQQPPTAHVYIQWSGEEKQPSQIELEF
jgi:hypothetical protein